MPAKSRAQQKMIFAKRGIYKTKENTPKKWQWIWGSEWTKLEEENNFSHYITQAFQERNESKEDHEHIQ